MSKSATETFGKFVNQSIDIPGSWVGGSAAFDISYSDSVGSLLVDTVLVHTVKRLWTSKISRYYMSISLHRKRRLQINLQDGFCKIFFK